MTADTRRVFAYSFPYLTPFYNVPVSFGNRNAGKVFIWQSKRNASSRTRLKAYPYEGNTSCDLFRTVGGITLNEYLYLFVALEYTDLKLLVNYYNSRLYSLLRTDHIASNFLVFVSTVITVIG
ncbi:hypothetical protein NDU88_000504 [Pleurodeles waltl]|uniref:Uncharacterized protein n=1 Tax=Pleurodeles waltl TaxID=8319 RepID=A0AAV7L8T9_PLEWA|nr:hypothetical protein NDU88_004440 [Pleurodeles waltl]KAJ1084289.1 hypothetical protein NDU88_004441 [Pleurodeles waltl]KAJ1084290.1 hypothetical protein NDU88_004442 [Pleurodeles waltl]KAJ1112236.1 hypothetical protein NDU88_000504 [Pleurodeles waltl]